MRDSFTRCSNVEFQSIILSYITVTSVMNHSFIYEIKDNRIPQTMSEFSDSSALREGPLTTM
jgi:hypothetical protein